MSTLRDRLRIDETGLEHPDVAALIRAHRDDLMQHSPPCSVHALEADAFDDPAVTLLSAWDGERLVGCGALKRHAGADAGLGELKTMRTVDAYRGQGAGAAMLDRLLELARREGLTRVALETGRGAPFAPALALYARYRFSECEPFADYAPDPLSTFLSLTLD